MLYLYDSRKKIACVVGALVLACTAGYYFFQKQEDQVLYGNVDISRCPWRSTLVSGLKGCWWKRETGWIRMICWESWRAGLWN